MFTEEELKSEEWKTLPEHPGYTISNLGRIIGPRGEYKPSPNNSGYYVFKITLNGKEKSLLVHRIVCRLFNGEAPEGKPHALHNNHMPPDCRASNLHWGSDQDNNDEMMAVGRNYAPRGEDHPNAFLDWKKVDTIRMRYLEGERVIVLATEYQVTYQTIWQIVRNKTWKKEAQDA